jgi:hypothetical protein
MKYIKLVFIALLFYFTAPFVHAEEITNYNTDLFLAQNGVLHVSETIVYDFGSELRHGITRIIPTAVPDTPSSPLKERYVEFSSMVVTRDGVVTPFTDTLSRSTLNLMIGNPDVQITGRHTYKISYNVTGALVSFTDGTVGLYWNAVGVDWHVPVQKSTATLHAPAGVFTGQSLCHSGTFGQSSPCDRTVVNGSDQFTSPIVGVGGLSIQQHVNPAVVTIEKLERFTSVVFYGGGATLLILFFAIALYFLSINISHMLQLLLNMNRLTMCYQCMRGI